MADATVTVVRGYPPNYDEIRAAFEVKHGYVYAWLHKTLGPVIFAPDGVELPRDLVAHESVHHRQQAAAGGAEAWWRRYIDEPEFRLEQEVEAYRVQWAAVQHLPPRVRRLKLAHMCHDLGGPVYGGVVTAQQARRLIVAA